MKNKKGLIILIAVMVIQLCVPVGMIIHRNYENNLASQKGEKYLFSISNMNYHDGCVSFIIYNDFYGGNEYAVVENDADGYAMLIMSEKRPDGVNYIKSTSKSYFYFPADNIQTEIYENLYEAMFVCKSVYCEDEDYYSQRSNYYCFEKAYLEAYVYKGRVDPITIYVDGMNIEEYLEKINNNFADE